MQIYTQTSANFKKFKKKSLDLIIFWGMNLLLDRNIILNDNRKKKDFHPKLIFEMLPFPPRKILKTKPIKTKEITPKGAFISYNNYSTDWQLTDLVPPSYPGHTPNPAEALSCTSLPVSGETPTAQRKAFLTLSQ